MDEIAAARFDKRTEMADPDSPPTLEEVLNRALRDAKERPEFDEVIVLLHNPEDASLIYMGNVDKVTFYGLLSMAAIYNPM